MMNSLKSAVRLLILATAVLSIGCAHTGPSVKRNVRIRFDPGLKGASVMLHLVALDTDRALEFQTMDMGKYWDPNNRFQDYDYMTKEIHFEGDDRDVFEVERTDPVWEYWNRDGARHLFVLANLPGTFAPKKGTADARRLIVPLDPARWRASDQIELLVRPDDVVLTKKPLPEQVQ